MTAGALDRRGASREQATERGSGVRTFTALGSILGALLALIAVVAVPGPSTNAAEFAIFLGRFHPLLVHLPIGALILVVLLESASLIGPFRGKLDGALHIALPAASLFGGTAFLLGLLLAHGGGYAPNAVAWHRGLTLAALLLLGLSGAVFAVSTTAKGVGPRFAFRGLLATTMGVLTVGAHFGGNLSRGEGYLTEYAPAFVKNALGEKPREKKAAPSAEPGAEKLVYRDIVAPIFERTCVECHGERSAKAKLRLDSLDAILQGGESGPAAIAHAGERSPIYARMMLPEGDDEHMPPDGHPAPEEAEREIIRWWIDRGANDTLAVADALPPSVSRAMLEGASSANASASSAPNASTAPPNASAAPSSSAAPSESSSAGPPGGHTTPPTPPANGLVYRDAVAPILAARCEGCHGSAKQKGKLRLDSIGAMKAGGVSGPAISIGDSAGSALVDRMRLPLAVEEHMPPPKSDQPSANEIDLVAWWIDHGADETTATSALPVKFLGTKPIPTPHPLPIPSASASTPIPQPSASASTPSTAPPVDSSGHPTDPPPNLPRTLKWESDVIVPLLTAKCSPCHTGESPVSQFGVDSSGALHKGGYSGAPVSPHDPGKSLLMGRLIAPMSDGDHMPPDGSEQLTPDQIDLVKSWIQAGATDAEVAPASLPIGDQRAIAGILPAPVVDTSSSSSSSSGGAETTTSSGSSGASSGTGDDGPPPLHGGGCASCSFETSSEDTALAVVCALSVGLVLVSRRKRK
jgi:hypothetical protein